MRAELVDTIRETLGRAGYHAAPLEGSACFNLVARRDDHLLLVKVLQNVDAFPEEAARELRAVAATLGATALLVGIRSSARPLEDGAVYVRHGVRIVTPQTLAEHVLDGAPPFVYAAPGGFYVRLDGRKLRQVRESRGMSLGDLAAAAGVSRRAISMYEDGMSTAVDVAARLEEYLEEDLVAPADPFERAAPPEAPPAIEEVEDPFEREVLARLARVGFRVVPARRAPFDGVARAEREVVITGVAEGPDLERRARVVAQVSEVAETYGTFVVERRAARFEVAGTALLDRDDLQEADEPGALVDLIQERRKKAER